MPESSITEESVFFIPVETLCQGAAVTCEPDLDVVSMARIMRDHRISCLVVIEEGKPTAVVSVRDCRDLLAQGGSDLSGKKVRDIMSHGLVTIRRREYVFDAIFRMSRHNIHRLAVINDDGSLFGVITDTDIVRVKTNTPLYLHQELDTAQSMEQLRAISERMLEMVRYAARTGADTQSLVQLISHFNDVFTLRVIALLEQNEGIRLPEGVAYLALGSEGRGEQTLRTDQDSAMVFRDDLPEEKQRQAELFAIRLVESLEELGIPRCPGNTMASNPDWRRPLSQWEQVIDRWLSMPVPDNMVNFGMFQDMRLLHGDQSVADRLREVVRQRIRMNPHFPPNMARHIVRFKPPIGMFGRLKVERTGANKGKLDIKKAGIFAVTIGASLLAAEAGSIGGNTWDKLELMGEKGMIAPVDKETVLDAFNFLVRFRLERQLKLAAAGKEPSNHVDPLILSDRERAQLRAALKGVEVFLRVITEHYQLHLVSR